MSTRLSPNLRTLLLGLSSIGVASGLAFASSLSWSWPCSSRSAFMASSSMGSPSLVLISSKRVMRSCVSFTPSETASQTVFALPSSGSCAKYPIFVPGCGRASPPNVLSTPAMIRRSELLPEPLAPMTPIFAPG